MSVRVSSTDRVMSATTSVVRPPATRVVCPILVGRVAELTQLRQAVQRPPSVITIEGEAGIGKTRLVQHLLAEPALANTARLVGQCSPLREPFPLGPVIDALTGAGRWLPTTGLPAVTAALRPLLPELADRLPAPLPPLEHRRQERHRLFRGIRELLACLGPTVLVLEDLHWIDPGTEELIRFLTDRPPPELSLVLTYRREDLANPRTTSPASPAGRAEQLRLALPPLTATEVAALVAAVHRRPVPERFSRKLYERTLGIPLAVEEVLGLLWDRHSGTDSGPLLDDLPTEGPRAVPATLRDALLDRVRRLSGAAVRLLHAATVLNHPATEPVLSRLAGLSELDCTTALAELIDRGLLQPVGENQYGFRHPLAQQAIHDSLSEPVRRALHRRAVRVLATLGSPPPLARLAHHSRAGGLIDQWQRYAEAAADQALALGDHETATRLLRQVVARPGATTSTRVRIAIKLGRAALDGLSHCAALTLLQDTLAEAELPVEARGELRLCLGLLLRNQSQQAEQGWQELTQAVTELAQRPGPAARAMASLGAPYLTDGHHLDEHLSWLARAEQTAQRSGDAELRAVVRVNLATALLCTADADSWRRVGPDGSLAGVTEAGDPRMAVNAAWSAVGTGRYRQAEQLLRTAPTMIDNPAGSYLSCALAGTTLLYDYAVGNWEGLVTRAEQVTDEHSQVASVVAEAKLVLGLLALATGRSREAADHLSTVGGSVPVAVAARAGLARLAAASGDLAAAERQVTEGLTLIRGKGVWCWAAELLPIAVAVLGRSPGHTGGGVAAAEAVLDEAARGLVGRDSPLAAAALLAGRALVAEAKGALAAAAAGHAEAARAYEALPHPYAAAQAWEAHGRCLVAAGQDATGVLTDVAHRYATLGATFDGARARHLLRSLGGRVPHRRGRRGYGGQLSPREREVVRLVRTGLTNREVAEALFLSPRTVEAHVARALRKLGLPSRRALATG